MDTLTLGGPCLEEELELSRADLAALDARHQVPDVGTLASGREGRALRFAALIERARPSAAARFVHVASSDGGFTANVPLEQARAGGLVLYELEGEELPRKYGGPFRLLFVDGEDCSVNVKFLGRVEFLEHPGSHTARCADA